MDERTADPVTTGPLSKTVGAVVFATLLLGVAAVALGLVPVVGTAPGGAGTETSADRTTDSPPTNGPSTVVEDVAGETTVTVTYVTTEDTGQFRVANVDSTLVDADADWAYLPASSLPPPLERVAGNHTAGVVTVGRWVLVGDLVGVTQPVGGSHVTVVAPDGMDVDPGRKAGFLSAYVSPYALQPDDPDPVTFVVAPDSLPSDARTYGETVYVTQHAFWDGDATSVWIHEYVHTRQEFVLTPAMGWFREASATYLAARIMEEQYGPVTEADVRTRFEANPTYPNTTLANRSAVDGTNADYYRGARLLYAVDAAIRDGSGGDHALVDVFRAMNRRDEPVTVGGFVRTVESYSGENETWIREAIETDGELDERMERANRTFETRSPSVRPP